MNFTTVSYFIYWICRTLRFLFSGLCADKIPHVSDGNNGFLPQVTFLSLKKRLTDLLKSALEVETNTTNTQIILGGRNNLFL